MFATNSADVDVIRRVPSCVCSQRVDVMESLPAGFTAMRTAGRPTTTWSRRLFFRLQAWRRRLVPLRLPSGRSTNARLKVLSRKIGEEFRAAFHAGVLAGALAVTNHAEAGRGMQGVIFLDWLSSHVAGSLLSLMVFDSQTRLARCGRNKRPSVVCDAVLCGMKPDVLYNGPRFDVSRSPASVLSCSGGRQVSGFKAASSKNTQEWSVSTRKKGRRVTYLSPLDPQQHLWNHCLGTLLCFWIKDTCINIKIYILHSPKRKTIKHRGPNNVAMDHPGITVDVKPCLNRQTLPYGWSCKGLMHS